MMESTGVVLAGGQSRRYGEEKPIARKDGKAFVLYSVDALVHLDKTIMVTRPDLVGRLPRTEQVQIITDLEKYRGLGPLAGIFSAMTHVVSRWYVVLPCDMPWIEQQAVKKLQSCQDEKWDVICSRLHGQRQPLFAVYHRRVKEKIRSKLDNRELGMQRFLEDCAVLEAEFAEEKWFYNVNTREEFTKLCKITGTQENG
ncbi:MAG: molybdenum cofactor guanylyltransferase [Thermoactinomyces sp.]